MLFCLLSLTQISEVINSSGKQLFENQILKTEIIVTDACQVCTICRKVHYTIPSFTVASQFHDVVEVWWIWSHSKFSSNCMWSRYVFNILFSLFPAKSKLPSLDPYSPFKLQYMMCLIRLWQTNKQITKLNLQWDMWLPSNQHKNHSSKMLMEQCNRRTEQSNFITWNTKCLFELILSWGFSAKNWLVYSQTDFLL